MSIEIGAKMTEFSFANFSENFDEHISKSIPGFDLLNYMILQLSDYFVQDNSYVTDIGCSTGNLIYQLQKRHSEKFKRILYNGYDIEEKMIKEACKRDIPNAIFKNCDVTEKNFHFDDTVSLFTSIFTMQFIPVMKRKEIIKKCYDSLLDGGALIISEKVLSESGILQNCLSFPHYDYKLQSFSEKEILDKERDLRKIMRCQTENFIHDILIDCGFEKNKIQCFWRTYNFLAILAIK